MTTSQILFLTGLLCGVSFAGVCLWAQRSHGSFGRRWWTVPGWLLPGRVQLVDAVGRVLLDEQRTLEPRCEGKSWDCTWDSYSAAFEPLAGGEMRLTVTLLTPHVPVVHVWMGDEEKTDGHRIPGY